MELENCPFCGSDRLKIESKSRLAGWTGIDARVEYITYSIRCNRCHARGGAVGGKVICSHLEVYQDKMPEWATTKEHLKDLAIRAWNRREK